MRSDKRRSFNRIVWRERLRDFHLIYLIVAALLVALTIYMFDPMGPAQHESGTILQIREFLNKYRGNTPYLVVARADGSVVTVFVGDRSAFKAGERVCMQLLRSRLFNRQSALLAAKESCRR